MYIVHVNVQAFKVPHATHRQGDKSSRTCACPVRPSCPRLQVSEFPADTAFASLVMSLSLRARQPVTRYASPAAATPESSAASPAGGPGNDVSATSSNEDSAGSTTPDAPARKSVKLPKKKLGKFWQRVKTDVASRVSGMTRMRMVHGTSFKWNVDEKQVLYRFVAQFKSRQLTMGWKTWKKYTANHREWSEKVRRAQVLNDSIKTLESVPPGKRDQAQIDLLVNWARTVHGDVLRLLRRSELEFMVQHLRVRKHAASELIFLQGEVGKHFFFVVRGNIRIFAEDERSSMVQKIVLRNNNGDAHMNMLLQGDAGDVLLGREVARVTHGHSLGEVALFSDDTVRTASAISGEQEENVVFMLPKAAYLQSVAYYHREAFYTKKKISFLRSLMLFKSWSMRRVVDTAYNLERVKLPRKTVIQEQGSRPDTLYFIVKGEIKLTRMLDGPDVASLRDAAEEHKLGQFKASTSPDTHLPPVPSPTKQHMRWRDPETPRKRGTRKGSRRNSGHESASAQWRASKKSANDLDLPTKPVVARQKFPSMELSILGHRSIVGIQAALGALSRLGVQGLVGSSAMRSAASPWVAVALTDVEAYCLRGKNMAVFSQRSRGTTVVEQLCNTYDERISDYKSRFRRAAITEALMPLVPPAKTSPFANFKTVSLQPIEVKTMSVDVPFPGTYADNSGVGSPISLASKTRRASVASDQRAQLYALYGITPANSRHPHSRASAGIRSTKGPASVGTPVKRRNANADRLSRRKVALDAALDRALEQHLQEERSRIMASYDEDEKHDGN